MASSKIKKHMQAPKSLTVRRTQAIMPCELCDNCIKIQWRCVNCEKYMCDNCQSIHMKEITFNKHQIVNVKTMAGEVQKEKLEELKSLHSFYSNDLLFCKSQEKELQSIKSKHKSKYDLSINSIKEMEKEAKKAIHKYTKLLCQEIENDHTISTEKFFKKEEQIQGVKTRLEEKIKELETAIQSNKTDAIFTTETEIDREINETSLREVLQHEVKEFVPNNITEKTVSDFFGTVKITEMTNDMSGIDFKVLNYYSTEFDHIDQIVTLNDKTAWCSNLAKEELTKINTEERCKTITSIPVNIFDMALSPNNDIYISVDSRCEVKMLSKDGEIAPFISVNPLLPRAIHVTKDKNIILGLVDKWNQYTISVRSCRKIVIFGVDGKEKKSFEFDKHKQRLFTLPYRVNTNINGDIIVIDRTDYYNGRIVALVKLGESKWIYPEITSRDSPLDPEAIATTSLNYVVVADSTNHCLHILSDKGILIRKIENEHITWPISLDIDMTGQLWIACINSQRESKVTMLVANLIC